MRKLTAAIGVAVASFATTSAADAQVVISRGPLGATWGFAGTSYPGAYVTPPGSYVAPYSYYAAPHPFQARSYVGYGSNDFPFYGRPYGYPYDPWTWPYMSSPYYYGVLARYYYPPVL